MKINDNNNNNNTTNYLKFNTLYIKLKTQLNKYFFQNLFIL